MLGDSYVNETLDNIKKGDPMAIYKSMPPVFMFFYIAWNNVFVCFWIFLLGILFSFGTAYVLFFNGVMIGAFQYFFIQKGLFMESASVVWIHGTMEIFSIIVGGAAGLVLGNSIMFPGTYSRMTSFMKGAKQGLKIIIGIVPFILIAALFESFVTRHTGMPLALKLLIISGTLIFMVWYFIVYPVILNKTAVDATGTKN
jgi:uncharacterized membrane protein SpoIIM required for sporulation